MGWPKTPEDRQLNAYWDGRGSLFTEVGLAANHWPERPWGTIESTERRLDGVIWREGPVARRGRVGLQNSLESMRGAAIDIIEVKASLSRGVIGQALVGEWLFRHQVGVSHEITVGRNTVLYRNEDPAMSAVADELGLCRENVLGPTQRGANLGSRKLFAFREPKLKKLRQFKAQQPGRYLARVPLGGPGSPWAGSRREYIPVLRMLGEEGRGVEIYEPQWESELNDPSQKLQLVLVNLQRPSRGNMGTIACFGKMFEQQYGRPLDSVVIVISKADAALQVAIPAIAAERGLPEVSFCVLNE